MHFNEREEHEEINAESVEINDDSAVVEPLKPFNPYAGEEVNVKAYSQTTVDPKEANSIIEEPTFTPPPIGAGQQGPAPSGGPSSGPTGPKQPEEPINPKLKDLPSKEKTNAAKQGAAMAMNGYEALHNFANWMLTIDEKNLKKMERKDEIDLRIPVPVNGRFVSMEAWVKAYNEEVQDSFTVDRSFKEEVIPVLERVMEKKGLGMTDEQTLVYLVAKDLAVKAVQFGALRTNRRESLNQLKDVTEAYRSGQFLNNRNNMPPNPQQPSAPPPPPPNMPNSQPEYTPPPPPPSHDADDNVPVYDFTKGSQSLDDNEHTEINAEDSYVETPSGQIVREDDLKTENIVNRVIDPEGYAAKQAENRTKRKYTKRTPTDLTVIESTTKKRGNK